MIQLSLFSEEIPVASPAPARETVAPALKEPVIMYCDVFVCSELDQKQQRIRIKPLPNQTVSHELFVNCTHKARKLFPVGTVFKIDVRLAQGKRGRHYLISRAGRRMERAIEYFEHNIVLQKCVVE